jgi:holin-like protein
MARATEGTGKIVTQRSLHKTRRLAMALLKTDEPNAAIRDCAVLGGQIALLWMVNWFSHGVVEALHIPVSGNVAAVLLMFFLLQTGAMPLAMVEKAATLLLRHLALFFLPIAVGLVSFSALWFTSGLPILVTLLVSALVGFVVTGQLCQRLTGLFQAVPNTVELISREPDLDSR